MKTIKQFLEEKGITSDDFEKMTADKQAELYNELNSINATAYKELSEKVEKGASKDELDAMVEELKSIRDEQFKQMNQTLKLQGNAIDTLKKSGNDKKNEGLKAYILAHSEVLKEMKANKNRAHSGVSIDVQKASETAADIGGRDYMGEVDTTIGHKPVRNTNVLSLFPTRPVSGEYIHYWEQDVVTRDAQFVVACTTSTHNTKQTWAKRTVELAKVRDMVDICIDMIDDYDFVESEMRRLIDESIKLKAEYELLLGASTLPTDMVSIASIASEFNAANPLADFSAATGTPFKFANLEQLADAMASQISIFGQENAWKADTIVMNFKDFVNYRNLKDTNGNKLINTLSDTNATIAGLNVITSPIVAPNTCYVFDSSKGSILMRKQANIRLSYENRDNVEHELVTMTAYERLQFYVRNIDKDAFMKCSDIATAITAITAP